MSRIQTADFSVPSPVPAVGLRVDVYEGGDEVVLRVCGEADLATAPVLRHALTSGMASNPSLRRLVLGLEELSFIDAYCLGIIVRARRDLEGIGCALIVRSPSPYTRHVFEICAMDSLLEDSSSSVFVP